MIPPAREINCANCGALFTRFNTIQKLCRNCTYSRHVEMQGEARVGTVLTPLKSNPRKPIKQRGKAHTQWILFRDKVARPYLDKKFGIGCSDCGVLPAQKDDGTYYRHDVDHVKGKGAHPELKFDVTNMVYRCRSCHIKKTGVPQWTPKFAA